MLVCHVRDLTSTVWIVNISYRSSLLSQLMDSEGEAMSARQLEAIAMVMSIASSKASKVSVLGTGLIAALPGPVKAIIETWSNTGNSEFPSFASWVSMEIFRNISVVN